jgi:hypothetical protein
LRALSGSVPSRGKLINLNSIITYHWPFYFSKTLVCKHYVACYDQMCLHRIPLLCFCNLLNKSWRNN